MDTGEWVAVALTLAAVLLRGVFAAAETALGSVGLGDAEVLAERGALGARQVVKLKSHGDECTTALRATQLFLMATAAGLAAYAGIHLLGPHLAFEFLPSWSQAIIAAALASLVVSIVALFLGDLAPRALAAASPMAVARRLAMPAVVARGFALPAIRVSHWISDNLLKRWGLDVRRIRPPPPLEDLERFLADHAARGDIPPQTPELIHSIFEFGETSAKEVMVPRTQVVALEVGATPEEVLQTLTRSGHTRLPVYREEIDDVVGIINSKDIVPLVVRGEPIELLKIIRPVTHVPWSTPIERVMREFQVKRIHIAMVVDEHGGLMGLITLEDILEEIVGEIEDEFDPVTDGVQGLGDGSFMVVGTMEIEDFNHRFGADIPYDDNYETLAGFLNSLAGALPEVGDSFFRAGLQLTVARRTDRAVQAVQVRRIRPLPSAGGAS